jgi:pyruvate,water dikinase
VLNVDGVAAIAEAVTAVWRSAWSESALAYRRRTGAAGPVRMGVVVQRLVNADVAGVLFTRNPITGADELVVEASWGLGETVVQGLVIPDFYRVAPTGEVLERSLGLKTVALRRLATGGTRTEPVEGELVARLCLADSQLRALSQVALRCADVFGTGPHDIEWAFAGDAPYLLQRRPVTAAIR